MEKSSFIRNFGVKDSKGRLIGARVQWWTEVTPQVPPGTLREPTEAAPSALHSILTSTSYVMVVHAQRDGMNYGASQPRQYFTNAAARLKACDKYLKAAAKRAEAKAHKSAA